MQTAFCSRAGRDETLQGFNTTSNGLEQKATVESLKIEKKTVSTGTVQNVLNY